MPTERDKLREAIRRTVAVPARAAPDAGAVAGAALGTWHEITARLAPVIGERGVEALFSRALLLTSATYPWLETSSPQARHPTPLAAFVARIEARDAQAAAEASQALVLTFTGLLADLIGSSLSERLLAPVWTPPPPPSGQESKHE